MLHSSLVELPVTRSTPSYVYRLERVLSSVSLWWAICLVWAGIQAWSNRHAMNPDGLSYLDMASNALRNGPQALVNGYWSPAYPAILSAALFVFRPSPALEFPVVHLANFLIFIGVLLCFTFFVKSWQARYLIPFGFGLFLWFTTEFTSLAEVTPDLCVAGVVYLAAGICCRISVAGSGWKYFAVLGAILGLGCYVKASMFPLGLMLLAALLVYGRFRIVWAGLLFLIVTAPLVALVSSRVGHLSSGETGRLNYAWYVNGLQLDVGWTAGKHAPRKLLDKPTTLEFAEPVSGTYPLWYDPSYWYAGAPVRFNLRQQLTALQTNFGFYYQMIVLTPGLFAGVLMLGISVPWRRILPAPNRNLLWMVIWPLGACLMYAMVHVEPRFVAAFFVLFWLAVYEFLCRRVKAGLAVIIPGAVLCTLLVPSLIGLALRSSTPDYIVVADALRAAGVNRGDRLATVGYTMDAYYARDAGARVVAQIFDPKEFWRLSVPELAGVKQRLASVGVKAIVVRDRPATSASDGWQDVVLPSSLRYSFLLLRGGSL